jgi:hypothetical protein
VFPINNEYVAIRPLSVNTMKFLVAVGILLLLSAPLLVGWVYGVNPSDFYYNIGAPLFDGIVLGLAALGVAALLLARVSLNPRQAMAIGIALLLVPVVVFLAGSATSETACFGPCNQNRVYVNSASCAGASGVTCSVSILATGSIPSVTGAAIAFGNVTQVGRCEVYQAFSLQSESLRCVFHAISQAIGSPFTVSISLSGGETQGIEGNLSKYVQITPEGISLESANCKVSANITCGLRIANVGNEPSSFYRVQQISYTMEVPGMCQPAGCKAFTQQATNGTCGPTSIDAGTTALVTCSFQLLTPPSGGGCDGALLFTDGAELPFGGNFTA